MVAATDPNKAKTARRVVEVLEFFDDENRQATVMDIARRYNRPQSSTSELLAILVEMGLLYKNPRSRAFMPTPRAAMLGSMFQPALVRDGRLSMLADRLSAETGLGVAVLGMVGRDAQVFRWIPGALDASVPGGLCGGALAPLHESAAGWLLLSTLAPDRRDGVLRRLNAEAPDAGRFSPSAIAERARECGLQGCAVGAAGFGASARMCAILLPSEPGEREMVLGLVFEPVEAIDPATLVDLLRNAVRDCVDAPADHVVQLEDYRQRKGDEPSRAGGRSLWTAGKRRDPGV